MSFPFHYSLNEVPSFSFSYVHYHKVEKGNFQTNDSAWFKKLTLVINYFFSFFDECIRVIQISFYSLFFLFMSLCFLEIFKLNKVFSTTKIYAMLILNVRTVKHSQHIPSSPYHLNHNASYSQWPCPS